MVFLTLNYLKSCIISTKPQYSAIFNENLRKQCVNNKGLTIIIGLSMKITLETNHTFLNRSSAVICLLTFLAYILL